MSLCPSRRSILKIAFFLHSFKGVSLFLSIIHKIRLRQTFLVPDVNEAHMFALEARVCWQRLKWAIASIPLTACANIRICIQVAVHGGDEIMLQGSETYSFIYEPYRPVDAHGPAVITAAMAGAKEAADPSAPEQPFQAAQARVAVSARSSGAAVQPSSLFNAATAGDIAAAADLRDAGLPLPLPFTLGTAHPLMHSRPQPTVLEPRAASGDVYEEASQHAGVVAAATAAAAADPSAVASPITACMLAHGSAADQVWNCSPKPLLRRQFRDCQTSCWFGFL